MNSLTSSTHIRQWRASISLGIEARQGKSVLVHSRHQGPLRVQRPFYPEVDGCCHVYLLHPPGGLVIGDELQIEVDVATGAQALLTTPSAGKIYGAKKSGCTQSQNIHLQVANGASLEWLPQETIIFDSAEARLTNRVDISGSGAYFGWDILRLGRIASGENFNSGTCVQNVELWRDGIPLLIERNKIMAGGDLQNATWGLRSSNTCGTMLATVNLNRDKIDELYQKLEPMQELSSLWGLTQKNDIFIARYLGNSITHCRKGFELIWRETREAFNKKKAIAPRIWNT